MSSLDILPLSAINFPCQCCPTREIFSASAEKRDPSRKTEGPPTDESDREKVAVDEEEADYQLPWALAIAWVRAPMAAARASLELPEDRAPFRFSMA